MNLDLLFNLLHIIHALTFGLFYSGRASQCVKFLVVWGTLACSF